MAAIATSAPPKLPVWQTVRASYAIVARNLGQLVRICWLWVLIMVPVYAALENWSGESGAQATYHWMRELAAALPSAVVDLPFLASIAVAWHRLVLREERVTKPAYLRLDGTVKGVIYDWEDKEAIATHLPCRHVGRLQAAFDRTHSPRAD